MCSDAIGMGLSFLAGETSYTYTENPQPNEQRLTEALALFT